MKFQVLSFKFKVSSFKFQVQSFKFHATQGSFGLSTRNFQLLTLFAASFFLLSAKETGCRKSPQFGESQAATETRSVPYLKKKLRGHERSTLNFVNAQAKIFMEGNGQSIGATANIIWVRDSVMWVNVKKFGLEAARVLVTADSVFVLNRLEKTYTARGLESLQRKYSLPAGFDLVQSLLLASPWFFNDLELESDIKDGLHRLYGSNGRFTADYRLESPAFGLRQEIFMQPRDGSNLSVTFGDFKKTKLAGWFPYLRTLEASSEESGDMHLSIELNEVEFNVPKSYRFEIPKHYEHVE